MGLPWKPETSDVLVARFPKALVRAFNVALIAAGKSDRPGLNQENVFDFEDGLRLIISKDQAQGRTYMHVSGSTHGMTLEGKALLEAMVNKLILLNGGTFEGMAEASASEKGVLHLVLQLDHDGKPLKPMRPSMN